MQPVCGPQLPPDLFAEWELPALDELVLLLAPDVVLPVAVRRVTWLNSMKVCDWLSPGRNTQFIVTIFLNCSNSMHYCP